MKHHGSGPVLSPTQQILLDRYVVLLAERAVPAGMVGRADAAVLEERHVRDALRAAELISQHARIVDLGSGAGLPGIPLAVARPAASFVLAEARRSRAAFLELVVDELRLPNVSVHAGRLEDLVGEFDIGVARAFASPTRTWEVASRLLPHGTLIYWAGAGFSLDEVPKGVRADVFRDVPLANAGPLVIMTRQ